MKTNKIHIDSEDGLDDDQFDEWIGAHDRYEFDFGSIKIQATSYLHSSDVVDILSYEKNGQRRILDNTLIEEPEFLSVLKYLKELEKFKKYRFYNGAYPVIPLSIWKKLEIT